LSRPPAVARSKDGFVKERDPTAGGGEALPGSAVGSMSAPVRLAILPLTAGSEPTPSPCSIVSQLVARRATAMIRIRCYSEHRAAPRWAAARGSLTTRASDSARTDRRIATEGLNGWLEAEVRPGAPLDQFGSSR
jgi:hypothetical protein